MIQDEIKKYLKSNSKLFDVIPIFEKDINITDPILIKGAIQSGKTNIICALSLYYRFIYNYNIIVILRNFTDDYKQYLKAIQEFINKGKKEIQNEKICIEYSGNIIKTKKNEFKNTNIFIENFKNETLHCISLANYDQIAKINYCINSLNNPYIVIIDEVDQLLYTDGELLKSELQKLLNQSINYIGISATLFEITMDYKFNTLNTFYLLPPKNYKGILDINFNLIEKFNGNFKYDECLNKFLNLEYELYNNHPFIGLIKTERKIKYQNDLMTYLIEKYKDKFTIITYNGINIKLYSKQLIDYKIKISKYKKELNQNDNNIHIFNNCSISMILQYLKENGGIYQFPKILIISHGLVGRGINIVSQDYQWHLTHMFYRPSNSCSTETLIQSMRLCGIYNDNISLNCYIDKKNYESLYKGYQLQEDIFNRIRKTRENINIKEFMIHEKIYKDKIDYKLKNHYKKSITNNILEDTGIHIDEFNKYKLDLKKEIMMEEKEFERLTNPINGMFQKWKNANSNIANFFKNNFDPYKKYSKNEINNLCKQYNLILKYLTISSESKTNKGGIYGKILKIENNFYYMYPQLISPFQKYFN
jgi:hypothetical protein